MSKCYSKGATMFKENLLKMEDVGGVFKAPAMTDEQFEKVSQDLKGLGVELPDEYAELLFTSDGVFWGGMEFFGAGTHTDKRRGLNITDLYSQNRIFQALNPDKKGCVILGHSDDENFIYNPARKKFQIIDEFEGSLIKAFGSFEDMFDYVVSEQIELVENYVAFNEDEIKDDSTDIDF